MKSQIAPWRWIVALFALSLGLGVMLGLFSAMTREAGPLSLALTAVVVIVLSAVGVWLIAMYWRRIDEAAREAHKWAWWWGGNVALIPVMAGLLFLVERPHLGAPLLPGATATPAHYVATGAILAVGALLLGYAVAWLFWWLWKSR